MSVITLEEAKNYLKVDLADDNVLIGTLIETAEDLVEKHTNRCLLIQTFELIFDEVGASIEITKAPLVAVTKIEVIDDAGVKSTVDVDTYIVDTSGQRGRVSLVEGCAWPDHRGFASFIITVEAGYGATAASVPAALRLAVLAALAVLYDSRGQAEEKKVTEAIMGLCFPYRIFRL